MKRVLVTGAAGFIGSHLSEALVARGDEVIGVDNFNDYYDPETKWRNIEGLNGQGRFSIHEHDICDMKQMSALFEQTEPEVVVHLAARAGVRPSLQDPNLYHAVNVVGGQNILDLCRDFKPGHLVFASSSSVYGGSKEIPFRETDAVMRPVSPYAATKRMNELQAHVYRHVYGVRTTLLRFFTVYGPRQRPDMAIYKFTKKILAGEPIPMFGDGSTMRDYTYVGDIVDGVVRAVERPFDYEIINLGESHTTSLRELIALIEKHTGKEAIIDQQPMQAGDVEVTYANVDHARELLGYNPSTTMDDGIARFVAWYRETHGT